MEHPACIRLPFLRPGGETESLINASRLWPGHGAPEPGFWQPPTYPLAPEQARLFLRDLESLSLADLERMRLAQAPGDVADSIRSRDEQADLAKFAGRPQPPGSLETARIQAQRVLLWRWFLEGCLIEIEQLERDCGEAEKAIHANFLEEAHLEPDPATSPVGLDDSWRTVLANTAIFLPAALPVLAEGAMAEILRENLDFNPDSRSSNVCRAEAPLWRALGHSRPATGHVAQIYNVRRAWLVLV